MYVLILLHNEHDMNLERYTISASKRLEEAQNLAIGQ